jgi:hypothetical protein
MFQLLFPVNVKKLVFFITDVPNKKAETFVPGKSNVCE